MDAPELPALAYDGDERAVIESMLDYYRAVFVRKCLGLTDAQLAFALPMSDLTLGGLLLHLAIVEDVWFDERLLGNDEREPWASFPWDDDRDAEFHIANEWPQAKLLAQYEESLGRSRKTLAAVESLDTLLTKPRVQDEHTNVRWMLVHLTEEYARHCGHADLLRQAIDGATGD